MATDSVMGLFMDPNQLMQQQSAATDQRAAQFAQMDPMQRAQYGIYGGASRVAGGLAGMMGVEDPAMKLQTLRNQVTQGKDLTTSEGWASIAKALQQAGDMQGASQAAQRSSELQIKIDEKQAARDSRLEEARMRNEAVIQAARERGATQLQIAQMQIESRNQLAQLAASIKGSQPRNLPASLQKEEGKDLEVIDTYTGQAQALKPALDALTPDEKGVRKLELGPLKNAKYEAQLLAGNSTPEARAYEGLKSAVDTAVNLQVSAEKGVQTDKDVLRFAKALIASYGRNDTEASYQALKRYQDAIVNAQERAKGRVESRRKSQGVDPYYVGETAQQPKRIKLD